MKSPLLPFALRTALVVMAVALAACDSTQSIIDALRRNIAAYPSQPTEEAAAAIDSGFDQLDAQIAKLQSSGRESDVAALRQQRDDLRAEYASARVSASLLKAKRAAEELGEAFRKAGESLGAALKGATNTSAGNDTP